MCNEINVKAMTEMELNSLVVEGRIREIVDEWLKNEVIQELEHIKKCNQIEAIIQAAREQKERAAVDELIKLVPASVLPPKRTP